LKIIVLVANKSLSERRLIEVENKNNNKGNGQQGQDHGNEHNTGGKSR